MNKPRYMKRLADWEMFDEITFKVIPRYKTSGLSGDEWRQHVEVTFWFKGVEIMSRGFRDMAAAMAIAPGMLAQAGAPIDEKIIELETTKCFQSSCRNDATTTVLLKRETSERGSYLAPEETQYADSFRRFCSVHSRRGDCSREDADDNHIVIEGPGPAGSTNTQESPSVMAPPIILGETP